MRVLITGGLGKIGRAVVKRLLAHGHTVLILDRNDPETFDPEMLDEVRGAEVRQADITDFDTLKDHFEGVDAVVHMAALVSPAQGPPQTIFDVNAEGTFNVFQACVEHGVKRVVSASSINALGFNYGIKGFPIQYLPIDEEHPDFTTDAYSFTKRIGEEIGQYFWRREGISSVSMRFPGVYRRERWANPRRGEWRDRIRNTLEELLALPEEERREKVLSAVAEYDKLRAQRIKELPHEEQRKFYEKMRAGQMDPIMGMIWGRTDFWASLDDRDAAQAVEKALLADFEGSHTLFINDSHNSVGVESALLAEVLFPEVSEWKKAFQGTETLVSIDKARDLIGFEPEHHIITPEEEELEPEQAVPVPA